MVVLYIKEFVNHSVDVLSIKVNYMKNVKRYLVYAHQMGKIVSR